MKMIRYPQQEQEFAVIFGHLLQDHSKICLWQLAEIDGHQEEVGEEAVVAIEGSQDHRLIHNCSLDEFSLTDKKMFFSFKDIHIGFLLGDIYCYSRKEKIIFKSVVLKSDVFRIEIQIPEKIILLDSAAHVEKLLPKYIWDAIKLHDQELEDAQSREKTREELRKIAEQRNLEQIANLSDVENTKVAGEVKGHGDGLENSTQIIKHRELGVSAEEFFTENPDIISEAKKVAVMINGYGPLDFRIVQVSDRFLSFYITRPHLCNVKDEVKVVSFDDTHLKKPLYGEVKNVSEISGKRYKVLVKYIY